MTDITPIRRALISVSDKTGIVDFARHLRALGVDILSTGGTYKLLKQEGIEVLEVSDYTQFPEMMDGRVKTLHPKIHGAILGRRNIDQDVMAEHNIEAIDLVIVNLYPFANTIAREDCTFNLAIENIDIGGPAMIRSAAKNHKDVAVVVNQNVYSALIDELNTHQGLSHSTRFKLALSAFEHTAQYDAMIANYLGTLNPEQVPSIGQSLMQDVERSPFSNTLSQQFVKSEEMRYGENPHQKAAFYTEKTPAESSISTATQHQGKSLSFNNIADTDTALECVRTFDAPSCVIVKHANPCGVASASTLLEAYDKAFQTDPTSAFGGIIAFNQPLDEATAQAIIERQFVEVIIAPEVSTGALTACSTKPNVRVLSCGPLNTPQLPCWDFKRVNGGLLVQDKDLHQISEQDLSIVTSRSPTEAEMRDLIFAWKVGQFVKSNAIVYTKNLQTIGIGAGQMSRVYSARIAGIKAADEDLVVQGSVMASDAFFPFRDGLDAAAKAGITAVIQPGGSIRDKEVIEAANEADIAMVFTGIRHFRH